MPQNTTPEASAGASGGPQPVEKVVSYVGPASDRSLSAADFKLMDPESEATVKHWNVKNGFRVPVSDLGENVAKVLTEGDLEFVIEDKGAANAVVSDKVASERATGVGIVARPAL